ncbi:MAG TPA: RIP metalloprotease RseP [Planctomycetota bacterium]|nr:RIP metalloprotease RseP [Planctomycetota bacterium]
MDSLYGWLGLIFGFSGLIFIHELGHFALAKWNGVKVYVFSLGMGPYLLSFTYKGTVYALSMIPIGGYVKLMGQDDLHPNEEASKDESDYRNKRPGQKAAILAAGAIFNLIFTLAAFTLCYAYGIHIEPPRIGEIAPETRLAKAEMHPDRTPANLQKGELVLEVNSVPVKTFLEAQLQISGARKEEELWLKVQRLNGREDLVIVKARHDKSYGASSIGMDRYTWKYSLPLGFEAEEQFFVADFDKQKDGEALKKKPAYLAGLRTGDRILSIEDKTHPEGPQYTKVEDLEDIMFAPQKSGGRPLTYNILRDGKEISLTITPVKNEETERHFVGFLPDVRRPVTAIDENSEAYKAGLRQGDLVLGFLPDNPNDEEWKSGKLIWKKKPEDTRRIEAKLTVPQNPAPGTLVFKQGRQDIQFYKLPTLGAALTMAWDDTIRFSGSVFTVLRGLFTGDVSTKALSGAVGIGDVMFKVASTQTAMNFLWFLGFISLNLGVLQFVPIPLLDGWHLLMVAVEKLKGSPVAPKIQEAFQYVGIVIVGCLLLLSFYNDIRRIFLP